MKKVQNARKTVNHPACQAPVVRSVYQAVFTIGRPHHPGVESWLLAPVRLRVLRRVPVLVTLEVVEYRLSLEPVDIRLAGLWRLMVQLAVLRTT